MITTLLWRPILITVRDSVEARETWKVVTIRQESKAKKGLSLIDVPWGLSEIWKAVAIEGATSRELRTTGSVTGSVTGSANQAASTNPYIYNN